METSFRPDSHLRGGTVEGKMDFTFFNHQGCLADQIHLKLSAALFEDAASALDISTRKGVMLRCIVKGDSCLIRRLSRNHALGDIYFRASLCFIIEGNEITGSKASCNAFCIGPIQARSVPVTIAGTGPGQGACRTGSGDGDIDRASCCIVDNESGKIIGKFYGKIGVGGFVSDQRDVNGKIGSKILNRGK